MEKSTSNSKSQIVKTKSIRVSERIEVAPSEEKICLPYFISSMFGTIIEDTVTQLRILGECNNELRISKTMIDMPIHFATKFDVKQPEITDELAGIDPKNLDSVEYKLAKLDADRKLVTKTFIDAYIDLTGKRSFAPLTQFNSNTLSMDTYRETLIEVEARNRILRRDLNKQLRQQRIHIKTVIYDTDVTIDELGVQVEDSELYGECRSRYVENWQRARTEQHIQTISNIEIIPSESIEYYKLRADYEQRVHSEVETLTNILINETLGKVEEWMDKYDADMEKIDLKIQLKKNAYYDMAAKRNQLEETIEKHDQLMKEWINFKDEREKARLYREKMFKSAIIVQAWWRGLLVRRQLGPYKVSKKKKEKGKNKSY